MYLPVLKTTDAQTKILTAAFKLCRLRAAGKNELLNVAQTLTLKALNPSSMEHQNDKISPKVFNFHCCYPKPSFTPTRTGNIHKNCPHFPLVERSECKTPMRGERTPEQCSSRALPLG